MVRPRVLLLFGVLVLLVVGGHAASADDGEAPVITSAVAIAPGGVTIAWAHSGDDVVSFRVEVQPLNIGYTVDNSQRYYPVLGLQPSTPYQFRVCATFIDGSEACSDSVTVTTQAAQPPATAAPDTRPQPTIDAAIPYPTAVELLWDSAGYHYDKFIIHWTEQGVTGSSQQVDAPGGDVGDFTVQGLQPVTAYVFQVEGCDNSILSGAICQEQWSSPYPVSTTGRPGDEWRTRWQKLDSNAGTVAIATGAGNLYQLHADGQIWQYTGTPCAANDVCGGWTLLDDNPATVQIVTGGATLYQRHRDGQIWQYTGTPKAWKELDDNPATTSIAADGVDLYQLHQNGEVWQYMGKGCDQNGTCLGWKLLDDNPATVQLTAGGGQVYQLHQNGEVWQYTGTPKAWKLLDDNPATTSIVAAASLYQLHGGPSGDGTIWQYTGTSKAWKKLDNNPATTQIAAGGNSLYQRHSDGEIWAYNAPSMTWQELDDNPATIDIETDGNDLYQLHSDGQIFKHLP